MKDRVFKIVDTSLVSLQIFRYKTKPIEHKILSLNSYHFRYSIFSTVAGSMPADFLKLISVVDIFSRKSYNMKMQ